MTIKATHKGMCSLSRNSIVIKKRSKISFEQIIDRGCGIDVHKRIIAATIKGIGIKEETRRFDGFTESIEQMRDWLKEYNISHLAMESTGVYWKPIYNILEEGFEILLVNAQQIKNVLGHDRPDAKME